MVISLSLSSTAAAVPLKSKRVRFPWRCFRPHSSLRADWARRRYRKTAWALPEFTGAGCDNSPMIVESNVPLQPYNSFGIVARAQHLARITDEADLVALLPIPTWRDAPRFVLGGGSNIVLTGDVKPLVLKVEIKGLRLVEDHPARLDRRGRCRRNLARRGRMDGAQRLPGPGEPGPDSGHRGRRAGAEHRRLRRRAAGPLRVARRLSTWKPAAASRSMPRNAPSATAIRCSSTCAAARTTSAWRAGR
jgi:hypothetical protein